MMLTDNGNLIQCHDIVCRIFSPESVSVLLGFPEECSDNLNSPVFSKHIPDKFSESASILVNFLILKRAGGSYYLTKFGAVLKSKYFSLLSELRGENCISYGDFSSEDFNLLSGYLLSVYDCQHSEQFLKELYSEKTIFKSKREGIRYDIYNLILLIVGNPEYFMIHSYESLPDFAVENIGMLRSSVLICDPTVNYKQNLVYYHELLKEADHIHGISTWGTADISGTMIECLKSGAKIELVISGELALKLVEPPYFNNVDEYRNFENLRFFVTDETIPVGLTVTDKDLSLGFYLNDRKTYDSIHDLVCKSDSCLRWGEELFSYYKGRSMDFEEYLDIMGCL